MPAAGMGEELAGERQVGEEPAARVGGEMPAGEGQVGAGAQDAVSTPGHPVPRRLQANTDRRSELAGLRGLCHSCALCTGV